MSRLIRSSALAAAAIATLGVIPRGFAAAAPVAGAEPASETNSTAAAETSAAPAYRLRFRFVPNQFAHYETLHRSTLHVALQEIRQSTRHSSQTHKHFRVVTVRDDGAAILETQVDWAVLSAQNDDEPAVVFDSRQDGPCPPVFRHVAESVGRPLARFTVSPLGLVRRNEAFGQQAGQDTEHSEAAGGPTFFIPLPERPVRIGDRWQEDFEVRVLVAQRFPQRVRLRRTFELVEVRKAADHDRLAAPGAADTRRSAGTVRPAAASDDDSGAADASSPGSRAGHEIAIIRGRTVVLSPVRDPSVAAQLAQREVTTEVHFDIDRGLIVYRETKGDKLVVGPFGRASSIRAVMHRVERLVPPPSRGADR